MSKAAKENLKEALQSSTFEGKEDLMSVLEEGATVVEYSDSFEVHFNGHEMDYPKSLFTEK